MPDIKKLQQQVLLKKSLKLFTHLNRCLVQVRSAATETQIHRLRILTKRFRALLFMLVFCQPKTNKRTLYRHYKKMFARAGKLRDTQLHVALIKHSNLALNTQTYWQTLATELKKAQKRFNITCQTFSPNQFKRYKKQFRKLVKNIQPNRIELYLQLTAQKTTQLLAKTQLADEYLHALRKLLKQWLYNLQLLNQCGFSIPNANSFMPLLSYLCEILGVWQDKEVAINYLKRLNSRQHLFAPNEFNHLINLWEQEKTAQRLLINQELPKLNRFLPPFIDIL